MIAVVILGTLIAGAFPLLFINPFRRAQTDQAESARRLVIDLETTASGVRIAGSHVESISETPTAMTH
jgi:type II secretory pathway pseudopilin PulG